MKHLKFVFFRPTRKKQHFVLGFPQIEEKSPKKKDSRLFFNVFFSSFYFIFERNFGLSLEGFSFMLLSCYLATWNKCDSHGYNNCRNFQHVLLAMCESAT